MRAPRRCRNDEPRDHHHDSRFSHLTRPHRTVRLPLCVVPALGQGTWRFAEDPSRRRNEIAALRLGLDLGLF
jgi:hypothetical protein